MKQVEKELTKETLEVAWVNKYNKGFELRCNRTPQFPNGYYEFTKDPKDARAAKRILLEKLSKLIQGDE